MNNLNNLLIENKKSMSIKTQPIAGLRFYIPNLETLKESYKNEKNNNDDDINVLDIVALEVEKSKATSIKLKNGRDFEVVTSSNVAAEKLPSQLSRINEHVDPLIIPFVELGCKNTHEVYKIAKSFQLDIDDKNKKCFSFYSFGENTQDLYVLTVASCLSYLENNQQVAVIVDDINCAELVRFRKSFTKGTIGAFSTYEWGNLTLIDYREILLKSDKNRIDISLLRKEFEAVFVVQPSQKMLSELREAYLDILSFVDSVSFIVNTNKITVDDLRKKESYFNSLGIGLKGIMYDKRNA